MSWRHLPAPVRGVAVAAQDAVAAATAADPDALDRATATLATAEGAGLVLGTVVRLLLEDLHPDGLDGDDVRQVLEDCVRAALPWQPEVDPHVVLVLLASALGVHDQDADSPQPDAATLARHAALLLGHLTTIGAAVGTRPLSGYLTAAFAEIQRTELQD